VLQTHNSFASAFWVQELQMYTTIPSFVPFF
jgi:hypothetical protein